MRNKYLMIGAIAILLVMVVTIIVLVFRSSTQRSEDIGAMELSPDREIGSATGDLGGDIFDDPVFETTGVTLGNFRLLVANSVAGSTFLKDSVSDTYDVRYVDRSTAHVYDISLDTVGAPRTVALTTVPRIREAFFLDTGSTTVLRYTDEGVNIVYSYLADITKTSTSTTPREDGDHELIGSFLPENIPSVAVSPDTRSLFYLEPTGAGVRGFVRSLAPKGETRQILEYPLRELRVSWPSSNSILLTTNPSADIQGYVFECNPTSQSVTTLLGPKKALTALGSVDGKWLLFSDKDDGVLATRVLDRTTGSINVAPFATMPEKCVWSRTTTSVVYCAVSEGIPNRDAFPDNWYKGLVSLKDVLWKYDVALGTATLLADPTTEIGVPIDAHHLMLDPSETHLLFRVRANDSLWAYTLPEPESAATSTEPAL